MKKLTYILALALLAVSSAMHADDKTVYQNSYNYQKAVETLKQSGNKQEALNLFKEELKSNPKNGYAYYWIAAICEDIEEYGDGLNACDNAVKYLSKDKEWMSYALRTRAEIHLAMEQDEDALKDWAHAIKCDSKNTDNYGARADYYYRKGQYDKSNIDWDKIIKLEPNNAYGYGGKGRNMLAENHCQEALDLFNYCIKLSPAYSQNYSFRADCYIKLEKWTEAADDIVKALSIDSNEKAFNLTTLFKDSHSQVLIAKLKSQAITEPNNNLWPYFIGSVYENNQIYDKAIEYYKQSNHIQEDVVICDHLSTCYEEVGNYITAIEYKNRSIELDPDDDMYISDLADLKYDAGDVDGAIADYGRFIELNPDFYGGYYRRGFMKDNSNDVDGAIEDYSMAITLNPNDAYSYLGRADKYLIMGETELAMADYRKVVEIDTVYSTNNCAQYAWLALGEKDKAIAFMDSVLVYNPNDAGNLYDAACLYSRMGEYQTSLTYLRRSLENGFRRFSHIENDDDLAEIRKLDEYTLLICEYKAKMLKINENLDKPTLDIDENKTEHVTEIPFARNSSGTLDVACTINDLPLHFCFDTGCSDVSISQVEANFMLKNGYLTKKDIIGSAAFSDALGNINEGTIINLRNVKFGDLAIDNVRASVVKNQRAPLLLGQTVLSRAGKVEIDNENKVLVLRYKK